MPDDVGNAAELRVIERHGFAACLSTRGSRTAAAGERTSAAGTPCCSSKRHERGRRSRAGERLDVGVQLVHVATRASRVAKRGSVSNLGRPIAANTPRANCSVGAQIATIAVGRFVMPKGVSRGTMRPGACGKPQASSNRKARPRRAMSKRRASRRRPAGPRRCMSRSAAPPEFRRLPNTGASKSATGTPTRTGGSAGAPEVIIRPLNAWMMRPSPCPVRSSLGSPPKPEIEQ